MSRIRKINRKGKVTGFVRFGLLPDEVEIVDRAAAIDERSRADFSRVVVLRQARAVIAQNEHYAVLPEILSAMEKVDNLE